jgi:MFS family permease
VEPINTPQRGVRRMRRAQLAVLLLATLSVSSGYGVVLLLPLYMKQIGGSEATYGMVTAAAALPAAAALVALLRHPRRVSPVLLLCGASLVYAAAAATVAMIHSVGLGLVVLGLVLGTAWAVVYTVAPMVVSDRVDDSVRASYIGYVTGTVQVGFGLGPTLGEWLHRAGLMYPAVLLTGAGLAAAGAALVGPMAVGSLGHGVRLAGSGERSERLGPALARIARSPARTPLIMILLAACLFTTMNSFQTTFARSRALDFEIYYLGYTIAVVAARLVLVRLLPRAGSDRMTRISTAGIAVAIVGFLLVGHDPVRYAGASALLGVTYGLTLPALQARTVNLATAAERPRTLPLAGLLFQVAILAFPLVAGAIITTLGYRALFAVLLGLALAMVVVGLYSSSPATADPPADRPEPARLPT